MPEEEINLSDWYTSAQAHARLEANAGRPLDPSMPRQVARVKSKPVRTYALSPQVTLYYKPDIDSYIVEERGAKVARTQRQRGLATKQAKKKRTPAKKKSDEHRAFDLAIL